MTSNYTFTSESVTEGHPDKMADQISDAVLDAILAEDPMARVACETMVTTGLAVVAGTAEPHPANRAIESTGGAFVEEVRGSLDYYLAQPGSARISRVVLSGGGPASAGWSSG